MSPPADPTVRTFRVGWGDLDGNQHMANVAYLDRAADTRLLYFAERGFPVARFAAEHLGPVIVRDELEYRRELRLLDAYEVDVRCGGLSNEGVRFLLENTFRCSDGEVAAIVRSEGVWFDLLRRRSRPPPADLDALQRSMPRSEGYRTLPERRDGPKPPARRP